MWSERDVTMEKWSDRYCISDFEDGERAKKWRWLVEAPLQPPEGNCNPYHHLDFSLLRPVLDFRPTEL